MGLGAGRVVVNGQGHWVRLAQVCGRLLQSTKQRLGQTTCPSRQWLHTQSKVPNGTYGRVEPGVVRRHVAGKGNGHVQEGEHGEQEQGIGPVEWGRGRELGSKGIDLGVREGEDRR